MESTALTALQEENRRLRERVTELEAGAAPAPLAMLFEQVVANLLISVNIWHREDPADPASLRLVFAHRGLHAMQLDLRDKVGGLIRDLVPTVADQLLTSYSAALDTGAPFNIPTLRVPMVGGGEHIVNLRAVRLAPEYLCVMVEDFHDRSQLELAQRQVIEQEEVIRRQQESLMELSTPLIPINDHVVVMPLIGAIDSRRAQQVLETLLHGIAGARTTVAILDITGVPIVDTQVANALLQAAQSVKLLGAQVVLTGIRPEVAQTLVGLGVNLNGIITMNNLQGGIAYATRAN